MIWEMYSKQSRPVGNPLSPGAAPASRPLSCRTPGGRISIRWGHRCDSPRWSAPPGGRKKVACKKNILKKQIDEQNIDIVITKWMLFLQKWRKIEKETNSWRKNRWIKLSKSMEYKQRFGTLKAGGGGQISHCLWACLMWIVCWRMLIIIAYDAIACYHLQCYGVSGWRDDMWKTTTLTYSDSIIKDWIWSCCSNNTNNRL